MTDNPREIVVPRLSEEDRLFVSHDVTRWATACLNFGYEEHGYIKQIVPRAVARPRGARGRASEDPRPVQGAIRAFAAHLVAELAGDEDGAAQ
jgi:hypothetical protein